MRHCLHMSPLSWATSRRDPLKGSYNAAQSRAGGGRELNRHRKGAAYNRNRRTIAGDLQDGRAWTVIQQFKTVGGGKMGDKVSYVSRYLLWSTTPFIIGSEVDVSCVLVVIQPAPWFKNKTHETSTSEPMINGVRIVLNPQKLPYYVCFWATPSLWTSFMNGP